MNDNIQEDKPEISMQRNLNRANFRNEQRRNFIIGVLLTSVAMAIIAVALLIFSNQIAYYFHQLSYFNSGISFKNFLSEYQSNSTVWLFGGIFVLILSILGFLYVYLSGVQIRRQKQIGRNEQDVDQETMSDAIKNTIIELDQSLKNFNTKSALTEEDRQSIVNSVIIEFQKDISPKILTFIENKYKESLESHLSYDESEKRFSETIRRLKDLTVALQRESVANLLWGLGIAALGLFVLTITIWMAPQGSTDVPISIDTLLIYYLPRIGIFFTMQVFAVFFLKLHRQNIEDRKYISNEITNIELKRISFAVGLSGQDYELREFLSRTLAVSERNFILNKGQSSVFSANPDNNSIGDLNESLRSIFGTIRKSSPKD